MCRIRVHRIRWKRGRDKLTPRFAVLHHPKVARLKRLWSERKVPFHRGPLPSNQAGVTLWNIRGAQTKIPQLIFSLTVAGDMAEQEGSSADLLILLIDQALKEVQDEALRRGIVMDIEGDLGIQ